MAIKERKQITGTTEQINAYEGHEGQIVWDKDKKTFVGMSGTAGTNYPLAQQAYVDEGLAGKANSSHTHWSASSGPSGWARDNSTGFTIQWGTAESGWVRFPRTFISVFAVTLGPWDSQNSSWGDELGVTGFKHHSIGRSKYIALGFS